MATNAAFLAAIQAISVTGVAHHYDYPPLSLNTGDLPAAFPLMPSGAMGEWITSCIATNKTRAIAFVVCVEPVGQDLQPMNYAKLAALMDNLETALDALTVSNFIEYEISTTAEFDVAGINYWAIVANISSREA